MLYLDPDNVPNWSKKTLQDTLDYWGPKYDEMGITLDEEDAREIITNLYKLVCWAGEMNREYNLLNDPEFMKKAQEDKIKEKEQEERYKRDFGTKVFNEIGENAAHVFHFVGISYLSRPQENIYSTSIKIDIEGGYTAQIGFFEDTSPEILRIVKKEVIEHYRNEIELRLEKPFVKRVYTPWFVDVKVDIETVLGKQHGFVEGGSFYPFIATKVTKSEEPPMPARKSRKKINKNPV